MTGKLKTFIQHDPPCEGFLEKSGVITFFATKYYALISLFKISVVYVRHKYQHFETARPFPLICAGNTGVFILFYEKYYSYINWFWKILKIWISIK